MKKNITIHDIAKELKLDSSTVSRALSNNPRVGERTKLRIIKKANELGYHRNLMASNLRTNKTMTIGVVVPYISRHFFSEAIDGIEQTVSKKNYRVIISQSHDKFEIEKEIVNGLFMNRVDGLLISPSMGTHNKDHIQLFINNNIPVVLFDRYYKDDTISKVIFEDKKGAYDLTQHLIDNDCKKIFHIAGNLNSEIYNKRFQGYKEALENNNLKYNSSYVKSINLHPEKAVEVIKDILKDKDNIPDGIVCANDHSALAIMKYLDEYTNYNVPKDIAIAGFSNEPASKIIKPGLTTVDQQSFAMGKAASKMLLNYIADKENAFLQSNTVVIKSELIIRDSTKRK